MTDRRSGARTLVNGWHSEIFCTMPAMAFATVRDHETTLPWFLDLGRGVAIERGRPENWDSRASIGAHSRHLGAGTSKEGGKPHAKADRIPMDRRISWFARRGSCANAIVFERRSGI
jgi:hypothetical protein